MYTSQAQQVKWGDFMSCKLNVMNGVTHGGVLSPILIAVSADGLLEKLEETGVEVYMGSRFTGTIAYVDGIVGTVKISIGNNGEGL